MVETCISVFTVLLLSVCSSFFISKKLVPKWDAADRGAFYGFKGGQWKSLLIISVIIAILFTGTISLIGLPLYMSVAVGFLGFFLSATALTDFKSHLIPKELSNMALLTGLAVGFFGFVTGQYYDSSFIISQYSQFMFQFTHFAIFMGAIVALFVMTMYLKSSFGFGDIKMFWASGLFMASFIMIPQMLVIFMGMFIVLSGMLAFSMVKAKSWKVSGGLPALPAFAVAFIVVTVGTNLLSALGVTY